MMKKPQVPKAPSKRPASAARVRATKAGAGGRLNLCVYCGSGTGRNPAFAQAARDLGRAMAENGIGLVYGGGSNGLMGEIARSVIAHGGHATGIIPETLIELEKPLVELHELFVVRNLHERKMLMFEKSHGFAALPGGLGTLEELVEQMTWVQLGHHTKPVFIINIENYWNPLLKLFEDMRAESFIRPGLEARFHLAETVSEIVPLLKSLARNADMGAFVPAAQ
jgi:uncharacterized protein (TIGR00730 family)